MKNLSLYLHIPFCVRKCRYCDFLSGPADEAVRQNLVNRKGAVELTDALAWAASQAGLMGFVPDGESFDLGNAEAYRNAVANFGEQNH